MATWTSEFASVRVNKAQIRCPTRVCFLGFPFTLWLRRENGEFGPPYSDGMARREMDSGATPENVAVDLLRDVADRLRGNETERARAYLHDLERAAAAIQAGAKPGALWRGGKKNPARPIKKKKPGWKRNGEYPTRHVPRLFSPTVLRIAHDTDRDTFAVDRVGDYRTFEHIKTTAGVPPGKRPTSANYDAVLQAAQDLGYQLEVIEVTHPAHFRKNGGGPVVMKKAPAAAPRRSNPKNFKLKWTAYGHQATGRRGYKARKRDGELVVVPEGASGYRVLFWPKSGGEQFLGVRKSAADALRLAEAGGGEAELKRRNPRAHYDDGRDAWVDARGRAGPNGPYRRNGEYPTRHADGTLDFVGAAGWGSTVAKRKPVRLPPEEARRWARSRPTKNPKKRKK